jgi:hypothetical protein
MRPSAISSLTRGIAATAVVVVPLVMATESEARHITRHHARMDLEEVRATVPSWSRGGDVCPGNARSIDCRIWPPPVGDDSDRKSGDGGGG